MTRPYNDGRYIYPPRTKANSPISDVPVIGTWQRYPDAIAQYKLNGTRNVIYVSPDRKVEMWNRHRERQKYEPTKTLLEKILAVSPEKQWTVWDTELMHAKTTDIKDTLYFYDCLVWQSEQLIDVSYGDRMATLREAFLASGIGNQGGLDSPLPFVLPLGADAISRIGRSNVFVPLDIPADQWLSAWERAQKHPWIEGLVLKRTGGVSRLESGHVEMNNGGWMCRVRKPHKNYQH